MTERPNFEEDDLDWAFGELLALTDRACSFGIYPHAFDRELFYACMCVINRQPLEVRQFCLNAVLVKVRYAHPLTH